MEGTFCSARFPHVLIPPLGDTICVFFHNTAYLHSEPESFPGRAGLLSLPELGWVYHRDLTYVALS